MTGNAEIVAAVTVHHEELQAALEERVEAVLAAARRGRSYQGAARQLQAFLDAEVVPHARAEEDVLYPATGPNLAALTAGMIFEHETLLALTAELHRTPPAVDVVGVARAISVVFAGHVRRENELLLPTLAADPTVDLKALLGTMRQRFVVHQTATRGS